MNSRDEKKDLVQEKLNNNSAERPNSKKRKRRKPSLSDFTEIELKQLEQTIYSKCSPDGVKPQCLVNDSGSAVIGIKYERYQKSQVIFINREKREVIAGSILMPTCGTKNCLTANHLFELLPNNYPDMQKRLQNLYDYIMAQCTEDKDTGCLLFNSADSQKYGCLTVSNKFPEISTHRVHVITYMLKNDEFNLPENVFIRHDQGPQGECSSTLCCNPDHLAKGDAFSNKEDDRKNGKLLKGDRNPSATITDGVAQKIIASKGNGTIAERATRFGTTFHVVADIDCSRTWTHLPRNGIVDDYNEKQLRRREETRIRCNSKMKNGFSVDEYKDSVKRIEDKVESQKCGDIIGHDGKSEIKDCQLLNNDFRAIIGGCTRSYPYQITFEHYNNNNIRVIYHPKTSVIRHLCQPREGQICVEPSHLKLGTAKENAQDRNYWASKKDGHGT